MRHKFKLDRPFGKTFVTSDNHFGHKMMAEEIRGFESVAQHDEYMIQTWNARVPKDGLVITFGDFSFFNIERTQAIFDRLNGEKFIIPGNHDSTNRIRAWFGEDHVLPELTNVNITDNGRNIRFVASHYPLASWDGSDKGSLMLHGHLHSKNNEVSHHFCAPFVGAGSRFDIGIDNAGWFGYPNSPVPIKAVWKRHEETAEAWKWLKNLG